MRTQDLQGFPKSLAYVHEETTQCHGKNQKKTHMIEFADKGIETGVTTIFHNFRNGRQQHKYVKQTEQE